MVLVLRCNHQGCHVIEYTVTININYHSLETVVHLECGCGKLLSINGVYGGELVELEYFHTIDIGRVYFFYC